MIKWLFRKLGYVKESETIKSKFITHIRVGLGDQPTSEEEIEKVTNEYEGLIDGDVWVTGHHIEIKVHDMPDIYGDDDDDD